MQTAIEAFVDGCNNAGIEYTEHKDQFPVTKEDGKKEMIRSLCVTIEAIRGVNSITPVKFHFDSEKMTFLGVTTY